MCSMGFAPKSGDVAAYNFTPPKFMPPKYENINLQDGNYAEMQRMAADKRISDELKEFLSRGNPIDLMENSA